MQELRLVAVSEDGTYLVLATAGRGTRFTLPVDDRLRAAVRGHFSRLGQFEIEVESPLRPKEIQARIRSGETAEEIAESAGIPVERVRWFEGPVLQEREYMAQQAQRVAVRRPGESAPGPPLGETVEERLGRGGVDLEEAEWDSWKCEDNTWRVRLSFFDNGRPHAAEWTFDPRRRHVSPLDEIAARLTAAEWDDEPLSDTVTPLVPRRPAMTVVSSDRDRDRERDRDPAPRGLPAEPEQAERPEHASLREPLRAAEPRDYIVEPGPAESRSPFRRPPEAVLREAARAEAALAEAALAEAARSETDDAAEAATGPPAPLRPSGTPDPEETAEPVEAAADVEETPEPEETVQAEEPDAPAEATAEEEAAAEELVEEPAAEPAEPEAVADQPEDEAPEAEPQSEAAPAEPEPEPVEAEKPPAAKPAPPQRTAQRQSSRTPAKKKQPSRPAMPAAAQENPATERPSERPTAERPTTERPTTGAPAAAASNAETGAPRPARRRKAKGKRASVPSWDEIMFGARRPE